MLGRLDPERFLGGEMKLDRELRPRPRAAARRRSSASTLLEAAEGIVTIANANMASAIRSRTIEKGHDPREFALVAFGGAGPLHAAEVADSLGHPRGDRAALSRASPRPCGLLTSDLKYDQMRTVFMVEGAIDAERLEPRARRSSRPSCADRLARRRRRRRATIEVDRALDCRYVGQGYELRVPLRTARFTEAALEEFHRLHEQEYGHAFRDPIEIVNLRVTAIGKRPTLEQLPVATGALDAALARRGRGRLPREREPRPRYPTRYYDRVAAAGRRAIAGPAVVFQRDTTTVVPPGWTRPRGRLRQPDPSQEVSMSAARTRASTRSPPR